MAHGRICLCFARLAMILLLKPQISLLIKNKDSVFKVTCLCFTITRPDWSIWPVIYNYVVNKQAMSFLNVMYLQDHILESFIYHLQWNFRWDSIGWFDLVLRKNVSFLVSRWTKGTPPLHKIGSKFWHVHLACLTLRRSLFNENIFEILHTNYEEIS